MYANGFFEQQRRSPASLAAVVGFHAAAFGLLVLYGTTTFMPPDRSGIKIITIRPEPPPPPPEPPRPLEREAQQPQHQSRLDTPPVLPPITLGPTVTGPPVPPQPPLGPVAAERIVLAERAVVPPPVRRAAEVDPNFRDALQPPYPRDQETAQRGGRVRVRITIGTNGRVTAIEQLDATNESFWRATERQARNRWRFRPATVDGRPVESTMTMTVTFRIPDA
jgi:periplasmic protein TonB